MKMQTIERVERAIVNTGAQLRQIPLKGLKAITVKADDKYAVFVDVGDFSHISERAFAEAHECGHVATGTVHALGSPLDLIGRQELKANRWAVHKFLPLYKIKKAMLSGYTEAWQLAELFDFDERFIRIALYVYRIEGKLNADL